MDKKLPIGIENFKKIRTAGFYYIDKTGLIRDLLNNWGEVNLFTRPRRFGKSLNMSMFQYFFELGQDSTLFEGLDIAKDKKLCEQYQGKFPVISITLKGVRETTFKNARAMLVNLINMESRRFIYLLDSEVLNNYDKEAFKALLDQDMFENTLNNSLLILTQLLEKHHSQKVILLIDEYDVPLDKSYQFGYYDEMVNLIRNVFNQALKSNNSLQFAIMTGCLRVSKESIFTGLNNPKVLSITDARFDEYFGFTDGEVKLLLTDYGLSEHFDSIKKWYNGYCFGQTDVYCPWDVINYCDQLRADPDAPPQEYWSNTSDNSIIRRFIEKADKLTQKEIEKLVAGETIEKSIRQELTYAELDKSIDNLWSVLFTTGYLTQRGTSDHKKYLLAIPNYEIRQIFVEQIQEWFQDNVRRDSRELVSFCSAFQKKDTGTIEDKLNQYLKRTISIRDISVPKPKKENFYHGILLGLLSHRSDWIVSSNAETGEGYSDILIELEDEQIGIIIEVKYAENDDLEAGCLKALSQIEENNYVQKLLDDDMKHIIKYGIACYKKHCKVMTLPD